MAGVAKTHIPNNPNHEKNCTHESWRMVTGIFLKSEKISSRLDFPSSVSSFTSSNEINSLGEYSLVPITVTKILPTKINAPIKNDHNRFKGTVPIAASFEMPNQFAKT